MAGRQDIRDLRSPSWPVSQGHGARARSLVTRRAAERPPWGHRSFWLHSLQELTSLPSGQVTPPPVGSCPAGLARPENTGRQHPEHLGSTGLPWKSALRAETAR